MNALTPYPTALLEPSRILLSKVRGADVPKAELVHAAYQVVGVCLGNTLPDGPALADAVRSTSEKSAVQLAAEKGFGSSAKDTDPWARPDGMKCECPKHETEDVLSLAAGEKGVSGLLDVVFMKKLVAVAMNFLVEYLLK